MLLNLQELCSSFIADVQLLWTSKIGELTIQFLSASLYVSKVSECVVS